MMMMNQHLSITGLHNVAHCVDIVKGSLKHPFTSYVSSLYSNMQRYLGKNFTKTQRI